MMHGCNLACIVQTSGSRDSVAGRPVDQAQEALPSDEPTHVLDDPLSEQVAIEIRRIGCVGGDDAVVELPQGMTIGKGLRVSHVETGAADPMFPESSDQVVGVHQAASGDVD